MASCPIAAIDDVFMFARDDMQLSILPLADAASPQEEAQQNKPQQDKPQQDKAAGPETKPPEAAAPDRPELQMRRADDRNRTVRVEATRLDALMDRVGRARPSPRPASPSSPTAPMTTP